MNRHEKSIASAATSVMNTHTPRTDSECIQIYNGDVTGCSDACDYVPASVARQLERDLAEAQREIKLLEEANRDASMRGMKVALDAYTKDLAVWRECADELATELFAVGLTADYLLRLPESAYDAEAELEGAHKALAAYDELKEES